MTELLDKLEIQWFVLESGLSDLAEIIHLASERMWKLMTTVALLIRKDTINL